jgi:uncharacterized protein YbjT (DUF2867 family)
MILITGSTGYIGRHLVARLIDQGDQPRCLVRNIERASHMLPADKVELVQGPETLAAAAQGIETIVHAGFLTADHKETPGNSHEETNVRGTHNLIQAAQDAKVKRMIEISGLGTKPAQPGSYMQGRYLAEKMLMESALEWTIIRPSILFGKGAPFIKGLAELIETSPVLPLIGGGKTMFQPIYVEDVVSVIVAVINDPERYTGKIHTIGGPTYYSFSQIFDILLQAMHKKRLKVYAPRSLVGIGATAMEAVLAKPPLTPAAMALFSFDNTTDLNSVERDFGFRPVSFTKYLQEHGVETDQESQKR